MDPITVADGLAVLTTLGLVPVIAIGATLYIARVLYKRFRG